MTDDGHISLKWKWYGSNNDVSGFQIERRPVDIVDFTIIANTSNYFYIDDNVPADKKASFIYRVHAFKGQVVSGYSNEARVNVGQKEIAVHQEEPVPQKEEQLKPTMEPAATSFKKIIPAPTSNPLKKTEPGTVWLVPDSLKVQTGTYFTTGIHVNSGKQKIAAFGIIVEYSDALLDVNRNTGDNGVISGSDGFIAAVNARDPGILFVSGFDSAGKGPGEDLHLFTIQWKALTSGKTKLSLTIRDLNDDRTSPVKNLKTQDGLVTIVEKEYVPGPNVAYYDEKWSTEPPYTPEMNKVEDNSSENNGNYQPDYNNRNNNYDQNDNDRPDTYHDEYQSYEPGTPTDAPYRTSAPEERVTSAPDEPDLPISKPTQKPVRITKTATPAPLKTEAPTATPAKTLAPTAAATVTPGKTAPPAPPGTGDVWIEPDPIVVHPGSPFEIEVHVNTGAQKIAAYGINFNFNRDFITIDKSRGSNGVIAGPGGFLSAANADNPGVLVAAGFDTSGKGPKSDFHLLTIYWKAVSKGNATILVTVRKLADDATLPVGKPSGKSGTVIVE